MPYASLADANLLYGTEYVTMAFDRDRDSAVDTGLAELMFRLATTEIDSFLVGRVPLPLDPVPLDVMMRCVDIAIYRACPSAAQLTEEKTKRFDAAQAWLTMVAKGEIKLTNNEGGSAGTHLTNRADLVTAESAYYEQVEGARWFGKHRFGKTGL